MAPKYKQLVIITGDISTMNGQFRYLKYKKESIHQVTLCLIEIKEEQKEQFEMNAHEMFNTGVQPAIVFIVRFQ